MSISRSKSLAKSTSISARGTVRGRVLSPSRSKLKCIPWPRARGSNCEAESRPSSNPTKSTGIWLIERAGNCDELPCSKISLSCGKGNSVRCSVALTDPETCGRLSGSSKPENPTGRKGPNALFGGAWGVDFWVENWLKIWSRVPFLLVSPQMYEASSISGPKLLWSCCLLFAGEAVLCGEGGSRILEPKLASSKGGSRLMTSGGWKKLVILGLLSRRLADGEECGYLVAEFKSANRN